MAKLYGFPDKENGMMWGANDFQRQMLLFNSIRRYNRKCRENGTDPNVVEFVDYYNRRGCSLMIFSYIVGGLIIGASLLYCLVTGTDIGKLFGKFFGMF